MPQCAYRVQGQLVRDVSPLHHVGARILISLQVLEKVQLLMVRGLYEESSSLITWHWRTVFLKTSYNVLDF